MTLAGTLISYDDEVDVVGPQLNLSTPYVLGELERGGDTPQPVRSLRLLRRRFGDRTLETAAVHDWLEAHFADGGGQAYVLALRGPAAAASSANVPAASGVAMTIKAADKGAAGDRLAYDIDVSGTSFEVKIFRDGVLVATSGMVATVTDAQAWAASKASLGWVTITPGTGADPVTTNAPVALAGGDDDWDGITTDQIRAQLQLFAADLGTGVYVMPGRTAPATHLAMADVAAPRNRLARCDLPAVSNAATLLAHGAQLSAHPHADIIDMLAERQTIPGLTPQTTRTAPLSFVRCAAEARNDADGISPNQPAAGRWGASEYAIAPTVNWSDADREALYDAGINVARIVNGQVRIYGSRTAALVEDSPAGFRLGAARLRMAAAELVRYQLQEFDFSEVDSGGQVLGDLKAKCVSDISAYQRSLYSLAVTVETTDGEQPGEMIVDVAVVLQITRDSEAIRARITRTVEA